MEIVTKEQSCRCRVAIEPSPVTARCREPGGFSRFTCFGGSRCCRRLFLSEAHDGRHRVVLGPCFRDFPGASFSRSASASFLEEENPILHLQVAIAPRCQYSAREAASR